MGLVVYVLPLSVPPQVPPTGVTRVYPEFDVIVNLAALPDSTMKAESGLIEPPDPALGVTVYP